MRGAPSAFRSAHRRLDELRREEGVYELADVPRLRPPGCRPGFAEGARQRSDLTMYPWSFELVVHQLVDVAADLSFEGQCIACLHSSELLWIALMRIGYM